jgi:uncharacterized membrane protein
MSNPIERRSRRRRILDLIGTAVLIVLAVLAIVLVVSGWTASRDHDPFLAIIATIILIFGAGYRVLYEIFLRRNERTE